ncbi:MAG: hypothetical protein RL297_804 [Pseudomonadota bacterium]|jgi:hypothetical protein
MRVCLFALLLMFCLPLQWASAATSAPCLHEPCASMHASAAGISSQAASDNAGAFQALHPHCCVSCHAGAIALLANVLFSLSDTCTRIEAGAHSWTEGLFVERPERPQWLTLA